MQTQQHINSQAGTNGNGGSWTTEDQIASLTDQALNGNTPRNRHLALVQLLASLNKAGGTNAQEDLVSVARDASIKHAIGLTDIISNLLTNTPERERNSMNDPDVLPIHSERATFTATPEWAETQIETIDDTDDEDQRNALIALLASIAPSYTENKYKHEIAWRAMRHLYKRMRHCEQSCREFVARYLDESDSGPAATPAALEVDKGETATIDTAAIDREIEDAKIDLLLDLAQGMKSERAYLRFAIRINERVGAAHLYPADDSPPRLEQAARTLKAANEMRNNQDYQPRTLEMLNELYQPDERLDREDLLRVSAFIQNSREIDSIFQTCGELLSDTEISALTTMLAHNAGGAVQSARIQLLLEHFAVLAARGNIGAIDRAIDATRENLYKANDHACGVVTTAEWIKEARADLVEYVTKYGEGEA